MAASALWSGRAGAQASTFTLDRAQLSGTPDDGFMVHRPRIAQKTRIYGALGVGYAHSPLRKDALVDEASTQNQMEDPIQGQFLAYPSAGIEILGRVGFNLHIPFVFGQITGADPLAAGVGPGGITDAHATMGDMRIDARGFFWQTRDGRLRFGGEGFFTLPTGTETDFGGDRGSSAGLLGSVEYDFGDFFVNANLGPHFRSASGIGGVNGDLYVGNELRYAFGAFLPMRGEALRLGLELWGSTGIENLDGESTFFGARNTTFEWLAQGRFLFDRAKRFFGNVGGGTRLSSGYGSADFRVMFSAGGFFRLEDAQRPPERSAQIVSKPEHYEADSDGDGYPDGVDGCPTEPEDGRGAKKSDGCPGEADADTDGLPDSRDTCPTEAEDFDGLADDDGCPEADLDSDGVRDEEDACADAPGPASADPATSGCATMTRVSGDGTIALLKPLEFKRRSTAIEPSSLPILDEVVVFLKARPELRLMIEGHTDNVGGRDFNIKLSGERAAAVVAYLVQNGIAAERLSSAGIGPDKPIAPNDTEDGRSRNRRVAFLISDSASAPPPANLGSADDW